MWEIIGSVAGVVSAVLPVLSCLFPPIRRKFMSWCNFPRLEDIQLSNKDYMYFGTRSSILDCVLKDLEDAKMDMVGLYGMGGVGKTTLVKEVSRKAGEDKLFDEVIFVEVTETPDIKKIQTEIAYELGLNLTDKPESKWRNELYARLEKDKKNKKILLILDNIWKELKLEEIGIPSGVELGGSKLLLTGRDRNVLESIGCQNIKQIRELSGEEAWRLFKKTAGDLPEGGELGSLAQDVCMKCGGLPVAIVAVAKALKNKTRPSNWREAIRQLERPSPENFKGDMSQPYLSMELSYNFLEGEELKRTFLLCSLMGHEASILDVAKYAMGLDIFQESLTMQATRDKIDSLIQKLKDKCLLLNGDTEESFSMHDFIREVAISIAKRDDHVFSVRNQNESEWPGKNTQETCTKIFIRDSEISENILGILECPELVSFALHNRYLSPDVKIPDNFFLKTTKLKVLDLTRMTVFSLRSASLDLLKNLQTLCLDGCKFGDVAVIGELKELKILSLRDSYVEQLPSEIGQLTKLRFLDLSNSRSLEVIPSDVISKLHKLEELYMKECPIRWETINLEELKHLSKLTTLEVDIKDGNMMPRALFSKELQRYKISIGYVDRFFRSELLGFDFRPAYFHGPKTSRRLIFKTTSSDVWSKFKLKCFKNVESLSIWNWRDSENVLDVQSTTEFYFCNLKVIKVKVCDQLKNIFSFSNARSLPQLESLQVVKCKHMREIFAIEREDNVNNNEVIEFSQLRCMSLSRLPQLTGFYTVVKTNQTSQKRKNTLISNDLQLNDVSLDGELDALTPLFNEKVVFPSLEVLDLQELNIERIWNIGLRISMCSMSCQNLTRLTIQSCGKLKYVFPSCMVESFKQLKHLEISRCLVLEEIVAKEGAEANATFEFPKVTSLKLCSLPELTTFYPGRHTSKWPVLEQLTVYKCSKLQIFTSDYKVVCPHLEVLSLHELNILKIWDSQLQTSMSSSCQNLVDLTITGCNKLKYLFPSSNMVDNLKRLQSIEISDCEVLEEVVAKGREETVAIFKFPKVTTLTLQNLPELMSFYPGEHIAEWPMLTNLYVDNCAKLQIFTPKYKVDFSSLEVLSLYEPDIDQEKWDNQLMSFSRQNLVDLTIRGCNKLKYLFPSSNMVDNLKHLQSLKISYCKVLEVVVAKGREETVAAFKFPKVTKLRLQNLPELMSFYPGEHIAEWPMLKKLKVNNCVKLQISTPKYKINILNLEELELGGKNMMMMILQLDKILGNRFCSQRVLEVRDGKAKFSKAKMGSGEDEIQAGKFSFLRNLQSLEVTWSLQWINVAPPSASFQNLTVLLVNDCERMVNLISSSTAKSLMQLREMKIERCPMMIKIVESQGDAETDEIVFSNLKRLLLSDLKNLAYFYSGNCSLNFPSLEQLTVKECYNMMTFSKGICSAPKLQKDMQHDEEDEECLDDDEEDEECSDAEDEQLQKKEVVFSNLEALGLQKLDNNEENWDNKFMSSSCHTLKCLTIRNNEKLKYVFSFSMVKSFEQLEYLEIGNCKVLEGLVAREGGEEAVAIEGGAEAVTNFNFPKLTSLKLRNLPKLTALYPGTHTSEWPMLKELRIYTCDKLQICTSEHKVVFSNLEVLDLQELEINQENWDNKFMSSSCHTLKRLTIRNNEKLKYVFPFSMVKSFEQLEYLEIGDCKVLEGVVAREGGEEAVAIEGGAEAVAIEGGVEAVTKFNFPKLTYLVLENLPKLTALYPGIHTSKWPRLKELVIYRCDELQIYPSEYKVVFSNLERLVLEQPDIDQEKWDNILMFLSGQNLKRLTIWGNGKLKYVFPFSMVKSFEQLEYLKIHDCEVLEGIVAREGGEEAVAMEGGVEAVTKFIFPKLTSLELENLPKLTSLYPGTYISDWPRLKEWTISACNKLQISRIRDQHSQFEGTELSGEEHDVDDMAAG